LNNLRMARSYLSQAEERLFHAEMALKRSKYAYCIRQCQETVELSLKGVLRAVGIEPPKWHDVGPILRREKERFPEWFKEKIDILSHISRSLRREREASMYGDEELMIPPDELYTEYDAREALKEAKLVFEICDRLYRELTDKRIQ